MTQRDRLERRVDMLQEQLARMDDNNDGSLQWVDDRRDLLQQLWDAQDMLEAYGGYRYADARC